MSVSSVEAKRIAESFVNREARGFRYEFLHVNDRGTVWSVTFAVYSPENTEIDGPIVILVDRESGIARSLYPE